MLNSWAIDFFAKMSYILRSCFASLGDVFLLPGRRRHPGRNMIEKFFNMTLTSREVSVIGIVITALYFFGFMIVGRRKMAMALRSDFMQSGEVIRISEIMKAMWMMFRIPIIVTVLGLTAAFMNAMPCTNRIDCGVDGIHDNWYPYWPGFSMTVIGVQAIIAFTAAVFGLGWLTKRIGKILLAGWTRLKAYLPHPPPIRW